jgi:hypothetical protein
MGDIVEMSERKWRDRGCRSDAVFRLVVGALICAIIAAIGMVADTRRASAGDCDRCVGIRNKPHFSKQGWSWHWQVINSCGVSVWAYYKTRKGQEQKTFVWARNNSNEVCWDNCEGVEENVSAVCIPGGASPAANAPTMPPAGASNPNGGAGPTNDEIARFEFCQAEMKKNDLRCEKETHGVEDRPYCYRENERARDACRITGQYDPSNSYLAQVPQNQKPIREQATVRVCTMFSAPCFGHCKNTEQIWREAAASGCTPIPGTGFGDEIIRWQARNSQSAPPDRGSSPGGSSQSCVSYGQSYPFFNTFLGKRDFRICFKDKCCPPFN